MRQIRIGQYPNDAGMSHQTGDHQKQYRHVFSQNQHDAIHEALD